MLDENPNRPGRARRSGARGATRHRGGTAAAAGRAARRDRPGRRCRAAGAGTGAVARPRGARAGDRRRRIELKGDRAAGARFVEALRLFSHLANVGDARSLVIHPASTTHFRMDERALAAAGIGEGTLRLSIGLEDPDDLVADLETAFKAAARAPKA